MTSKYLLDTHALFFWNNKESVSQEFIFFLDQQNQKGMLYVSDISFWEIALLVKKGKIDLEDTLAWATEFIQQSGVSVLKTSYVDMIESVKLPDVHKDPFDRILISQAKAKSLIIVTKDKIIPNYEVEILWM